MLRWAWYCGSNGLDSFVATSTVMFANAKGKEVDFPALLRMEPDGGTANIRNTTSAHWRPWLGPEHRCAVPFTSFSEFNRDAGGDDCAFGDERPLAFFAGIWTTWTSVRKVCEGEVSLENPLE